MSDPYLSYLDRFFRLWLPVYDLFAASIAPAYSRAAQRANDPQGVILDLATGTGQLALRCRALGAQVFGGDVTLPMLLKARRRAARARRSLQLTRLDARSLPFRDGSIDTVLLGFALHDMPARVRLEVLREAARVARRRVLVLDYDPPRSTWLRRLWVASLALVETAYFRGFCKDGGVAPLLQQAGFAHWQRQPAFPGVAAL